MALKFFEVLKQFMIDSFLIKSTQFEKNGRYCYSIVEFACLSKKQKNWTERKNKFPGKNHQDL